MIRSLASDAPTIGTAEAEGKARLTSETARPFRQLWRRLETTLRYTDLFRIDFLLWIPTFFWDFVVPCWCLPNCKLGACQTANWVRPDSGFRNHRPFFTINHVDHKLLEILLLHSPSATTHRFWPLNLGQELRIFSSSLIVTLTIFLDFWKAEAQFPPVSGQCYYKMIWYLMSQPWMSPLQIASKLPQMNQLLWVTMATWRCLPWPLLFCGSLLSSRMSPRDKPQRRSCKFGKFVGKNGEQASVPKRTHRDETVCSIFSELDRVKNDSKTVLRCNLQHKFLVAQKISRFW